METNTAETEPALAPIVTEQVPVIDKDKPVRKLFVMTEGRKKALDRANIARKQKADLKNQLTQNYETMSNDLKSVYEKNLKKLNEPFASQELITVPAAMEELKVEKVVKEPVKEEKAKKHKKKAPPPPSSSESESSSSESESESESEEELPPPPKKKKGHKVDRNVQFKHSQERREHPPRPKTPIQPSFPFMNRRFIPGIS